MSDGLILRAEQGLLGTMLATNTAPVIVDNLTVDDFAHPAHQALYTALRDLEPLGYDTERLTTAVAELVDRADVDAAWLRELAAGAPTATLLPEYVRIVVQASFDRDVADFGAPYTAAAQTATDESARESLTRLAAALDAQAAVFAPASSVDPDRDIRLSTSVAGHVDAELHREDQVIADIVQHPEQGVEVARWLDSAVFTTAQRRMTYELAVSMAYDGDAFDTVTLAWNVERARDILRLYEQKPVPEPEESDYTYISRLHAVAVTAGTAIVVGRDLLTEQVQAALAVAAPAIDKGRPAQARPVRQVHVEPPTQAPAASIRPIEL